MSIGERIQEARLASELTQEQLALDFHLSKQMVSHVERGRRKLPKDVMPKAIETLDCGFVAVAAASEVTGGAWVTKLDGDHVDLHRSSVRAKTEEELHEALNAISSVCVANHPSGMKEEDRRQLEEALIQAIDAITALTHYVSVICRDYRFSWNKLWKIHRSKLKARKFIK